MNFLERFPKSLKLSLDIYVKFESVTFHIVAFTYGGFVSIHSIA